MKFLKIANCIGLPELNLHLLKKKARMIAQDCEVIFIIFNDSFGLKSIIKPEKRASVRLFGL